MMKNFGVLFLKALKRISSVCAEAVTRRSVGLPSELKNIDELDQSLRHIEKRWPTELSVDNDLQRPVFILSAGWRSGSTLLQRLICSSGDIVIWGEPLDDAAIIPRMASTLSLISENWPPENYFGHNLALASFKTNWIANVTPPMKALRMAHRVFLQEWLEKPAREIYGVRLWGLKEVRLTIQHARYLKWLFPNARFVFVYRNLISAYGSWRGNTWGGVWPGYFPWSPIAYARHWKLLLSGYLESYRDVSGYVVKYEDIISGKLDLDELANYVGISRIDPSVLDHPVGSPDKKRKRVTRWVTPIERALLMATAGKLMRKAGYR